MAPKSNDQPWVPEELWSVIEFLHSAEGRELGDLVLWALRGRPARGLPAAVRLSTLADRWLVGQVAAARQDRWSSAQIGRVLGTSKQTAHRRFAARLEEADLDATRTEADRDRAALLAWARRVPDQA